MIKHFLITGLRSFRRNKSVTILNIFGLAIGLATVVLILEFIIHEITYDRFHTNKDNIYRVIIKQEKDGVFTPSEMITAAVGPSMLEDFPEVGKITRFANPTDAFMSHENNKFPVENLSYADSSIFEIFSFPLIKGNSRKALTDPFQVVLTESMAAKIFGDEDPLFKVVRLNGKDNLVVTGIMEDVPSNSHLKFGALVSFSSLYRDPNLYLDWDGGWNYLTYVLIHEGSDLNALKLKFTGFMEKNINYKYRPLGFIMHLDLQPLSRIHLYSGRDFGLEGEGDLQALYIFSSIALFILIIACINFINLTTARSFARSREIGLRKVSGASRRNIIFQFLFESLLISIFAFLVAIFLVELFQNKFNQLIGKELTLFGHSGLSMLAGMVLLILFTSILAGSYPAWFISRFPPLFSIKGIMTSGKGKSGLRNFLVVFQFMISVILIILTISVYTQMKFMNSKPLGYTKDNVVVIPMVGENTMQDYRALRDAFNRIPQVTGTGASSEVPGYGFTMNGYFPEGSKEPMLIHVLDIDADYLDVMKIPVIQGREFDRSSNADSSAFLINESLASKLGWDNPVGKTIYRDGPHKVIGVTGDFHFNSLHEPVQPLIMTRQPWLGYNYLSTRIQPGNQDLTVKQMEAAWNAVIPEEPFDYFFQDEFVKNAYSGVRNAGEAILWFSFLAIFVAGLGLLGLANFTFSLKKKQIGIRKVLGAESGQIAVRLTLEFLRLVILAGILALPVAWLLTDLWLDNFAYRAFLSIWIFIVPILFVTILAWMTIYFQVRKLADTNPVDVLKFE